MLSYSLPGGALSGGESGGHIMHKKAYTIAVVLLIALVTLACIATVAMADKHKAKKDNSKPNFDDHAARPSVTPKPTPGPSPVATPTPIPTPPLPIPTPIPTPDPLSRPQIQTQSHTTLTPAPTPESAVIPVNNSPFVSLSQPVSPTPIITPRPTPLVSDVERPRTGSNPGIMLAVLSGLACAGYIIYLGYVMIRK